MPKNKVTLLDRARADLGTAKMILERMDSDDVFIDVAAHHCQQCVEKAAKFLILMQGDVYANDHRTDEYLPDLKHEAAKELIEQISFTIDRWATTIRYSHTILASKKSVEEVIPVCERLIKLAEKEIPPQVEINNKNGVGRIAESDGDI